jgi:release factor glutamine methyltransferase
MTHKGSKIRALIAQGEYTLAEGPHPERARRDCETLLLHVFNEEAQIGNNGWPNHFANQPNINSAWLIANQNLTTLSILREKFMTLVNRRLTGEPIQYILGETEFYGQPFRVTPDVLIPRPETEHLIEKVLVLASNFPAPRVIDIGTGSGAIAVALAHHLPHAQITAIDLSKSALAVAHHNAKHNGVTIRFLEGDLLTPVAGERFEIIVSNPPYVPSADRAQLSVEVRDYEPALALFAGEDGLEVYRRLIPAAFDALTLGGFLALEIGYGQLPDLAQLLTHSGFQQIEFTPDLQGIPRVACAHRPTEPA